MVTRSNTFIIVTGKETTNQIRIHSYNPPGAKKYIKKKKEKERDCINPSNGDTVGNSLAS